MSELAEELACHLVWSDGAIPDMFVEENPPRVVMPPVKNQFDYLVALHELGHVSYCHTQSEDDPWYFTNGVLRSEVEAWDYALAFADEEIEAESKAGIRRYLQTYLDEAKTANGRLWHIVRPRDGGLWKSPAFRFDAPIVALEFLTRLGA